MGEAGFRDPRDARGRVANSLVFDRLSLNYFLLIGFLNLFIKGLVYVSFYIFLMTRFGLVEDGDWDLVKNHTGIGFLKKIAKTGRAA